MTSIYFTPEGTRVRLTDTYGNVLHGVVRETPVGPCVIGPNRVFVSGYQVEQGWDLTVLAHDSENPEPHVSGREDER